MTINTNKYYYIRNHNPLVPSSNLGFATNNKERVGLNSQSLFFNRPVPRYKKTILNASVSKSR